MATQEEQDESESEDGDSFTRSTQTRVRYLGSVMAAILIVGWMALVGAVAFGYASLGGIGASAFSITALLVLAAGGWTFGMDLVEKYVGGK